MFNFEFRFPKLIKNEYKIEIRIILVNMRGSVPPCENLCVLSG
jgi:hypothetical protein